MNTLTQISLFHIIYYAFFVLSFFNALRIRFYTLIPHDFGEVKPAILKSKEQLEKKYELLGMLSDIEVAAQMLEKEKAAVDPLMGMYEANMCMLMSRYTHMHMCTRAEKLAKKYRGRRADARERESCNCLTMCTYNTLN